MNRFQWKSGKIIVVIIGVLLLYLIVRLKYYEHKTIIHLNKVHPSEVWEFVADFSNMKYLNPTITDFNIIDESGNYEHWKYTAEYSEYLSHWPHLPNYAVAHFNVKANPKKDSYYIQSLHETCLMSGLFCVHSEAEFKFSHSISKGTICEENIKYQCPVFLSAFCRREVVYQRNAIMNNLKKKFVGA